MYEISFNPEIAKEYGVDEAIIIKHLDYWLTKNQKNEKNYYEGRYWTYCSLKGFSEIFPFYSPRQIRRILINLEKKGVLLTGNFNKSKYDRTKWYSFTDEFVAKFNTLITYRNIPPKEDNGNSQTGELNRPNEKIHLTEWSNEKDQMGKPIPDNNTDTYTQIQNTDKESIAAGKPAARTHSIPDTQQTDNPTPANDMLQLPDDIGTVDDWLQMTPDELRGLWRRRGGALAETNPRAAAVLLYVAGSKRYLDLTPSWDSVEQLTLLRYPDRWVYDGVREMVRRLKNGGNPRNYSVRILRRILDDWQKMGISEKVSPYDYLEARRSDDDAVVVK